MRKLLLLIPFIPFVLIAQAKIKIACIGNSITEGYSNYPTSLLTLLGEEYEVGNFGNWGHTLVIGSEEDQKENPAYMAKQKFIDAQNYQPDIVIIKLGTNDSKTWFWNKYKFQYESDLRLMISTFQSLESKPKVILCRPIPAKNDGVFGISDKNIREDITVILQRVANDLGLTLVDAYAKFRSLSNLGSYYIWDGIHVNFKGAHQLALAMYEGIKGHPFNMKSGGVELNASTLVPVENTKTNIGQINFGPLPSYQKIDIQLATDFISGNGSFSLFLDNESTELVNVPLSSFDNNGYASVAFNRTITDIHSISIMWNNQTVGVQSISFKEKYLSLMPESGKAYYIINKATNQALTVNGTSLSIASIDKKNNNQHFYFEEFTYGAYIIQTAIDGKNNICNDGSSGAVVKEDVSTNSVMRFVVVDDGLFIFGTSNTRRFGINSNTLKTNRKDTGITDNDKWRVVKVTDIQQSSVNQTEHSNIKVYSSDNHIIVKNNTQAESVVVVDVLGRLIFNGELQPLSNLSIAVGAGLYVVKTLGTNKNSIKILVK